MRTWNAAKGEIERKWWIVDAEGKNLGRLASEVAQVIRGKHKPQFTPEPRHRGLRNRRQR